MNLDHLDNKIPKRWLLLLYYWLPFFKTPSNFYFECRSFIDNLKRAGYHYFSWDKFPDLVFIFEKYAKKKSEINLSKQMIDTIFTKKTQPIPEKLIEQFFERFNPDNQTLFLNEVLQRLPTQLYNEYFSQLNAANCSSKQLKWCTRLKEKFKLEDKLHLTLSLPDENLIVNQSEIFQFAIHECETQLLTHQFSLNKFLTAYTIEQLIIFIFTRNPTLIFSDTFIRASISQLLKTHDPVLTSYILKLNEHERDNFFKNFLVNSHTHQDLQKNIPYFLSLCPEEHWSGLIDQLINAVFNAAESEMTDDTTKEKKLTTDNPHLLVLTQLQKDAIAYRLSLFQFFAIQRLTKKPLDLVGLAALKNVFDANHSSLELGNNFSTAHQSTVAENSILAIKIFIKDHFMIHVPRENTRKDIHRVFYQFFNNEYSGKPLNVAKLILKKLPEHLQSSCEPDLNFLQQLLTQLYLIIENPAVVAYKNNFLIAWSKSQRDFEEKNEARRELLQRIREGKQSSIAYQRMEELFGSEAQIMQEKWKKALGVHFFDANDKEEYKLALQEADQIKKFNHEHHEHNDFSCLSVSPLSVSYFAL